MTNTEHAVTGSPQIVAGHSALRELFSDIGVVVQPALKYILESMTTGYIVDPSNVAYGLQLLYKNKDTYNELSKASIDKFSNPIYSWENISKNWSNVFEELKCS